MSAPSIALALGGGGARGLSHILMIEALDELGITPAWIAGTSIGACVGAGAAAGMSGREMRAYALETFAERAAVLAKLWTLRPRRIADFFTPGGLSPAQVSAERVIELFMPPTLPRTFEELTLPFTAIACDFYGWKQVPIETGELRSAIAASIAIPFIFRPVMREECVLVDGGVVNPLPFDAVRGRAEIIVAVDVIGGPRGRPDHMPGASESIFGATQLLMQTVVAEKLAHGAPHIVIRPDINSFRVMDFLKVGAILDAAEPAKDRLKRALEEAIKAKPEGA